VEAITIDGVDEHDFRHSIEDMLRSGEVDAAAKKLRSLLEPYTGEGGILPSRFLSVCSDDVVLAGWDSLEEKLAEHDRLDHPITALGIAVADPREAGRRPDADGRLSPCIETSFFSDNAYPFSEATREDLLDGYSRQGSQWQGDYEACDTVLGLEGIDDLFGAVAQLEARLMDSDEPAPEEIQAGSLGACYLAVIVHQAVRDAICSNGLPRSMCVMAGCNGIYPYFDAPVSGNPDVAGGDRVEPRPYADVVFPSDDVEPRADASAESVQEEASLLGLVSRKGRKKPVITLDRDEADEAARLDEFMAMHSLSDNGRQGHDLPADLRLPVSPCQGAALAVGGEESRPDADHPSIEARPVEDTGVSAAECESPELHQPGAADELPGSGMDDQDGRALGPADDAEQAPEPIARDYELADTVAPPESPANSATGADNVEPDAGQVVTAGPGWDLPPRTPAVRPVGHSLRKRMAKSAPEPHGIYRSWIKSLSRWFLTLFRGGAKDG